MSLFFKKKKHNNNSATIRDLKKLLGFKPKDTSIYILALTHKSVVDIEDNLNEYDNNERLEYLGDAILDAVISEILYNRFPTADEGFLTQMRTKIVNGKKLTELAEKIKLDKLIITNKKVSLSDKILEDAFESLIGAIFIDRGYKCVNKFISQKIMIQHIDLNKLKHVETNYKSRLIEWAQKYKHDLQFYTESESDTSKLFISIAKVGDKVLGKGKGLSKKKAEQVASEKALHNIENKAYFN